MGDLYVLLDKGNGLLKDLNEKDYSSYLKTGLVWTVIAVAGLIFKRQDVAFTGSILAAAIGFSAFVIRYSHELEIVKLFSQVIQAKDQLKTPPLNLNFQDMPKSPKPHADTPKTPKAPPIDWMGKINELQKENEELKKENASLKTIRS